MTNFAREELRLINQMFAGLFLIVLFAYGITRFQDSFSMLYFYLFGFGLSIVTVLLFKERFRIFSLFVAISTLIFGFLFAL